VKNLTLLLLVLVAVMFIAAASFAPTPVLADAPNAQPPAQATATPAPPVQLPAGGRLALVKSRGKVVCGVNDALPGFSALDKTTVNSLALMRTIVARLPPLYSAMPKPSSFVRSTPVNAVPRFRLAKSTC
jgi:hypothetical protein